MEWKSILKDTLSVCVVASLLGLAYNFYSDHTLPIFHEDKKLDYVDENALFGNNNPIDTTGTHTVTTENAREIIDSLKEKQTPADTLKKPAETKNEQVTDVQSPKSHFINLKLFKKYISDPRIVLIDARSPEVYSEGHIGKAKNIFPLAEDRDKYLTSLMMLPRDKTIIIYCDGGNCDLSDHVYEDLKNFDYHNVFIYQGGWEEWTRNASHKQ